MNQQQTKHARERIESIANAKCAEIKAKFEYKGSSLTIKQKTDQIRNGKAKLKSGYDADDYGRLENAFIFEGEEKEQNLREKAEAKVVAEQAKIIAKMEELIDELILGDASEVLQKIREFEKM